MTIIWGEADPLTCTVSQCLFGEIMLSDLAKGFWSVKFYFRRSFLPPADTVPSKPALFKKKYTVHNQNLKLLYVMSVCHNESLATTFFVNILQESSTFVLTIKHQHGNP